VLVRTVRRSTTRLTGPTGEVGCYDTGTDAAST
jgi:hypothetical protein